MLGVMHFNMPRGKYGRVFKIFKELIASQVAIVEEQLADEKDLVHGRRSYYSILRKYYYKNFRERGTTPKVDVFNKIETKQNKK